MVVETDRCVALVSSGHRRLRPGFLQDVANLPDSPEPLSRSSRDCHSLATTPACQLSSVAWPPSNCQPTATLLERATDFRRPSWVGPCLLPELSPLLSLQIFFRSQTWNFPSSVFVQNGGFSKLLDYSVDQDD